MRAWIRSLAVVAFAGEVVNTCHAFVLSPRTDDVRLRLSTFGRLGRLATTAFSETSSNEDHDQPSELTGIGIGIDLGTTYSCVAVVGATGTPEIIPIPNNGRTMPSVVHLADDGSVLVGNEAIEQEVDHPTSTYRNVKRLIGTDAVAARQIASVVPNVLQDADTTKKGKKKNRKKRAGLSIEQQIQRATDNPAMLYTPTRDPDSGCRETCMPEEISQHVVARLIQAAEEATGETVTRAVVGVPAYFNDLQEEATKTACHLAGLEKVQVLREPEAAAMAYGVGKEQLGEGDIGEFVLVIDLGGGTYDVSMLAVGGGVTEVVCTAGDVMLGGSDFDLQIATHFSRVLADNGSEGNMLRTEAADAMVRAAEAVRIVLSKRKRVILALPLAQERWENLAHATDIITKMNRKLPREGISNSTHVLYELTRKKMEKVCEKQLTALLKPIREVAVLSGAMLPGEANPLVVDAAISMESDYYNADERFDDFYTDDEERPGSKGMDDNMILALKKTQQRRRQKARTLTKAARKFREEKRRLSEQSSPDIKIEEGIQGRPISQVVFVGGATKMPAIGRLMAALTGVVPKKTINPDEAVALGCAVKVGLLDGDERLEHITVLDPFEAAVMRFHAEQQGYIDKRGNPIAARDDDDDIDDDDHEWEVVEDEDAEDEESREQLRRFISDSEGNEDPEHRALLNRIKSQIMGSAAHGDDEDDDDDEGDSSEWRSFDINDIEGSKDDLELLARDSSGDP